MPHLRVVREGDDRPKGKSIAELRAIVAADMARFIELAQLWEGLTEAEQVELILTAKAMLVRG